MCLLQSIVKPLKYFLIKLNMFLVMNDQWHQKICQYKEIYFWSMEIIGHDTIFTVPWRHTTQVTLIYPWCRICAWVNWVSIGSDNCLSPIRCQALEPNFNEILIKIQNVSFTKMHLKISSAKWRLFCPGEDELRWQTCHDIHTRGMMVAGETATMIHR